mmetsp:Transcript_37540/g.82334  ORF Transcript_37540/g.82334 Transcript_37540/m.82334 type:complete len:114 (+) Transcript_37540:1-342(+)
MFFVSDGTMRYTYAYSSRDGAHDSKLLSRGKWICEAVLWVTNWEHLGQLETEDDRVVLLALLSPSFGKVIHQFPNAHSEATIYAQQFLKQLNDLPEQFMETFHVPKEHTGEYI